MCQPVRLPGENAAVKHEGGRLLIAEDDEVIRTMLRRFFETRGFAVVETADGEQALAALAGPPPDLVLLDMVMPGRGGLEVLQSIRARYSATDLPVIMASARGQSADVVEALRLGANDYLVKPFDFSEALARVQTQLSLKRSVDRIVSLEHSLARRNAELAEANRHMREGLQAAAAVQRALLPRQPFEVPGARFAWHFRPCDELAGDLLNVVPLDDRHIALYVLDVMGHGVKAALLAVMANQVLGQMLASRSPLSPARVAAALTRAFPWDDRTEQFFTLLFGVLDLATGRFHFVSAGHPGPVWLPCQGPARAVPARGVPIGLGATTYEAHTVALEMGDRLYLYSDGLIEAPDHQGQCFGRERLLPALEANRSLPLADGLTALAQRVEQWAGPRAPHDDTSILAVEWLARESATRDQPPSPEDCLRLSAMSAIRPPLPAA